ncbi:MAG: PAS domain S-box protein, partial [Nitrospirae bacterium]|nr:PAS domain S-box protein [Nitrospirota bacterium]
MNKESLQILKSIKLKDIKLRIQIDEVIDKQIQILNSAFNSKYQQFESVLDSLISMVSVSDIKSREILYANNNFRKEFGDITNQICWHNLCRQSTMPCKLCANELLIDELGEPVKECIDDFYCAKFNKWYVIIRKAIWWDNCKYARLETIVDITERKKIEVELREKGIWLENAQEMASLGFYIWNIPNDTIFLSDQLYIIAGFDKETYTSTMENYKKIIHPEDLHVISNSIDKGESESRYRIINQKTKEIRYIHAHRNIIAYSSDGKPNKILGTVQDITNIINMEEQLKRSNEKFKVLAEESANMILIFANSRLKYINKKGLEILGYSKEELTSNSFDFRNILSEKSLKYARKKIAEFEENKKFLPFELEITNKYGRIFHMLLSASSIYFSNEKSRLYIVTDITAQKQTEELLRNKEFQIRLLMNSVSEAICAADLEGNCTFVNNSFLKMLGYKESNQVIGKNLHELIHHTNKDGTPHSIKDCKISIAHKEFLDYHSEDEIFWRADGTNFPVEFWSHPIIENDTLIGFADNFIDISKRKAFAEELSKSNTLLKISSSELKSTLKKLEERTLMITQSSKMSAIGEMATGLAHEINQPLTEIMLLIFNLFNFLKLPDLNIRRDDFKLSFEILKKSSNKIDSIIKHMRLFARQQNHHFSMIDINNSITETITNLYQQRLKEEEITLSLNLSPIPLFNSSQFSLEQAFMILINNAREAISEKETILKEDKKLNAETNPFKKTIIITTFY